FVSVYGELAASDTKIEEAAGVDSRYDGAGAKVGIAYDTQDENTVGLLKGEAYMGYMASAFHPGLSNYRYTRSDSRPFSKHIYFTDIKDEDNALVWGDGLDRGRSVFGLKTLVKSFDEQLSTDIKYRNVHKVNGKYVESVLRTESTYEVNPRLTSKVLAYYQHLPKSIAGLDPHIYAKTMYALTDYFSEDDSFVQNSSVLDNKDPSVGSFGLGAHYKLIEDFVALEGIYERTNDPLDFPRGLLNDLTAGFELRDGVIWDKVTPYLYDQQFFDLPPYNYYNVIRTRLIYTPTPEWEFILRYTFNENKHATGLDDTMNHAGIEAKYTPTEKLTFWGKYIFSRLIDIYDQNKYQRSDFFEGHHNFFLGSEYFMNRDESLTFLFGEFVGYNEPYQQTNWSLSALDTQHIFRVFYRRKF
ncbi:MAG: hypothetical protein KKC84_06560, partial [Candidatus Omnitrophica bacterium]|nr:hypothetical protein [Candidatus Omnitrophota bacterium]